MNFMEAVKEMKDGKSVIRKLVLKNPVYLRIITGTKERVFTTKFKNYVLSLSDYEATDWEKS